jgi:hypothetical protein
MRRAIAAVPLLLLLVPGLAAAKSTKNLTYAFNTIWTTAVRLLRADRGYKITDRDKESGYILFVYPGRGSVKECAAALELVPSLDDNGYKVIRVQLEIAHQASYVEFDLLDRLERKLREERGEPPPARKPEKDKPKPPAKDEQQPADKPEKE